MCICSLGHAMARGRELAWEGPLCCLNAALRVLDASGRMCGLYFWREPGGCGLGKRIVRFWVLPGLSILQSLSRLSSLPVVKRPVLATRLTVRLSVWHLRAVWAKERGWGGKNPLGVRCRHRIPNRGKVWSAKAIVARVYVQ